MRRLHPPTLLQWGCDHHWKTTTTRRGQNDVVRVRYLTCRRCDLKVKTEERLTVPWDERDLVTQVKALLPEGQAVALRDKGVTALPLAGLNARLASHGYMIHASKGRDAEQLVPCSDGAVRVERFELFELRRMSSGPPGTMHSEVMREKIGIKAERVAEAD